MTFLPSCLLWLYRQTLRLYPSSYRLFFAEEMDTTFRRRLEECDERKPHLALLLFIREVRDLPVNVMRAYQGQRAKRNKWQGALDALPTEALLTEALPTETLPTETLPTETLDEESSITLEIHFTSADEPVPWSKIALTILPGLSILAMTWSNFSFGLWTNLFFVGLCVAIVLIGIRQERPLPVWCYPTCGLLICVTWLFTMTPWLLIVVAGATLCGWSYAFFCLFTVRRWVSWQTWVMIVLIIIATFMPWLPGSIDRSEWWPFVNSLVESLAMPFSTWLAIALIPLALRHGLRAALLVLGAGYWIWQFGLDFSYFLGGSAWQILMSVIWTAMVLVVTPIWVLRARNVRQQELGLVVPVLIAMAAIVPLEALARHAPDLLTNTFDIYRFLPDSGNGIHGVGMRPREELVPALWQNFDEARAILVHWLVIIGLYHSLRRVPYIPDGFTLWQRKRGMV